MPSTSKKQHNFMAAIANNPAFAKKVGVPQSVGQDFNKADKGRKFSKGGDTMASKMNPGFMAMMAKKKEGMHKMPDGKMMKDSAMKMNSGGMPMVMKDGKKVPAFAADGEGKMKHGGAVKKMASGGMTKADMKQDKGMMQKAVNKHEGRLHKGAAMTKLAKGGGIESRGKTKGKII